MTGSIPVNLTECGVSNKKKRVRASVLKETDTRWIVPLGPKGTRVIEVFTSLEEAVSYIDSVN